MKFAFPSLFTCILVVGLAAACQNQPDPLPLTPVPSPNLTIQASEEALYPPYYNGLLVWGGFVYFGYGQELYWLEVSDPTQPVLRGHLTLPNRLTHITLNGDQAQLILTTPSGSSSATLADGWQQLDLSEPPRPHLTTFYDSPLNLRHILIYRDTAFLATSETALIRLDLSNAAAPRTLSPIGNFEGSLWALGLYDHYLLVESAWCLRSCSSTLNVLDAAAPQQPLSQYAHYGAFPTLLVDPPHVILAGSTIHTLDLTRPEQPTLVAELEVPAFITSAVKQGDWLYAATGSGLITFNLSQMEQPQQVNQQLETLYLNQISYDGDLLAVIAPQSGLYLFSLTDPAAPRPLAYFQLPVPGDTP
ncbi:MAG: hypothetical protein V9G20_28975 [Candidatus Promineifilaceae bacterium]